MSENVSGIDESVFKFAPLTKYSFRKRLTVRIMDLFLYLAIYLTGMSARFEPSECWKDLDVEGFESYKIAFKHNDKPAIIFWHDNIFLQTYWWRFADVTALVSTSYHGEMIARAAQRLGFGMIRGSSTRRGTFAFNEMIRLTKRGHQMLITVDGPLGPRHEVKKGAIMLAKLTGIGLAPTIAVAKNEWTLTTWDKARIPKPFTKAKVFIDSPVFVPSDADDEVMEEKRLELERKLDELVSRGEKWRVANN